MPAMNRFQHFLNRPVPFTVLTKGLLLVAVPLLFQLVLIGLISKISTQERDAESRFAHTKEVLQQVELVLALQTEAQAGSLGFMLTENPLFVEPFYLAEVELPKELNVLRALVQDNPEQLALVESIEQKAAQWREFQNENIRLVRAGARDEAVARIATLAGKNQIDALRRDVDTFRAEEQRLNVERQQHLERTRDSFRWVLAIGTAASMLLAIGLAVAFTRGTSQRLAVLVANTKHLMEGKELAPPVGGTDEITTVDQSFREMAQTLAQSREELAKHNRVLQSMLDNMGDGVVVVDDTGKFLVFNRAAEHILGVGPTHTTSLEWSEQYGVYLSDQSTLCPPEQLPLVCAMRGEAVDAAKLFVRNPERSEGSWITVTARPLKDDRGEARGGVAVFQDVTQRVQAEAERDRFFDISLDILSIAKADGYFKRINPAFSRILGWSDEEILARPFLDFVHPDDREATLREVERQVVAGQPVLHFENRYGHKDGSWRLLSWKSVPQSGGLMYATARDVTDAKRAEKDLRRSEQNLAITLDSIGDAVIATDATRCITRMNPVAEQLTGWKQPEAVGRPIDEVFHIINEGTRSPAIVPVDDVLATGIVHAMANHTLLIARDGTERPIADSAAPIRDDAGNISGVVLVFRDVTDERRFERELQRLNADLEHRVKERSAELAESNRQHRTLLSNLRGIAYRCRHDADWTMEFVSEGCRELLEIAPDELTSGRRTYASVIHPDDRSGVADRCEAGLRARQLIEHEYRIELSDGRIKWVWEKACGIYGSDGSVVAIEGFITDITERKDAENALKESEKRLSLVVDVGEFGVWDVDLRTGIAVWNDYVFHQLGYPPVTHGEARVEMWSSLVLPSDLPGVMSELERATQTRSQFTSEHRLWRADDREIRWNSVTGHFFFDEHGQAIRLLGISHDITDRKQMQLDLQKSERFNQATLDALSSHVAVLDATGKIVATNLAWRGFAQANNTSWQTVGEGVNYLAICDRSAAAGNADAAAASRAIRQVIAGEQESWVHEYPCHSADEQRWFYCRVTRFHGVEEIHVVVTHENITDMKKFQEQLATAQLRFETLSRVSPVAIMFFDSNGKCIEVNDRWCEMSGIDRQVALGDGWHGAMHPDDRLRVTCEWNQAVRDGEDFYSEYRLLRPDGEVLWLLGQGVALKDPQGATCGFIRASTDVTEQKLTEDALRFLAVGSAALSGTSYYEAVVQRVAELLNCEIVAICHRDPRDLEQFLTFVYYEDGQILPNFGYSSPGTPCADVINRKECFISSGVQQQYPDDAFLRDKEVEAYAGILLTGSLGRPLGHLVAMSRRPFSKQNNVKHILQLFAVVVAAETERQAIEQRFADLFEFSPDAIVITNRNGIIVQANRQVATVFGWVHSELVGQPIEVLMPASLRAGHSNLRERYLEAPLPRAMGSARTDLLGLRKDGSVFPVDISLCPMQTPDGQLVAATVRDVTERRNVLKELQSAASELREAKIFADTVIENVSGLFYVLDQNGIFVRWNESMQDLLGLSSDQMRRTHAIAIVQEADQGRIAGKIAEVFTNGHSEAEARLLLKDCTRHFLLNGRRLDINGLMYLVGSGVDITDRRQAEEEILMLNRSLEQRVRDRTTELSKANAELVQASRFKSEFLAAMSHELRTPLNGVLGMNELLQKTPLTDKQRGFVEASSTSGRALLSLVNDVLDIAKIEAGKMELDIHGSDIEALAYDIITMFSYRAKQKGVSLSCRLDPETCVTAMCDDNRLRQILVNLLGNALKFTSTGSVILESKCIQRDDHRIVVRLSVRDTGPGIPDDKVDRLFSPFSQIDQSTSRQFGGTGLGLSIAKQLVELMGGTVGVKSRLGVGSTFWIEVPFELVNVETRTVQRKQLLNGTKVLAVDGVDRERRQIADCLESWGCPFQHVGTLREAVETVAREEEAGQPFAVILADCRLAIGDEFIHLQNLARRPDLPVIGLGIGEGNDLATHLRQLGLRHLLRDPVRPSALFNALTSVLAVTSPTVSPNLNSDAAAEEQTSTFFGHILVAEDNNINQMFVRELLKYCGCTCDIVNNGDEALTSLRQNRYDLALMDCQMPEMDGFTATREIRRLEAAGELPGRLPIIALTANALKGDRERCLESGMDDYLSKPLKAVQLQAMLAKYLPPAATADAPVT